MLYNMLLFPESVGVLRELEPHSWESFGKKPDWMVTLTLFILSPSADTRSPSPLPLTLISSLDQGACLLGPRRPSSLDRDIEDLTGPVEIQTPASRGSKLPQTGKAAGREVSDLSLIWVLCPAVPRLKDPFLVL